MHILTPDKRWRQEKLALGLCSRCGNNPLAAGRSKRMCRGCLDRCKEADAVREKPPSSDAARAAMKTRRQRIRAEVLAHYGGQCACCGEPEPAFLQIDHINGGGTKHRKELGLGGRIYEWLRKHGFPAGFRVLCANCNAAIAHGGICPHQLTGIPARRF